MIKSQQCDLNREEVREQVRGMMMTVCDIAAISKPWPIQKQVSALLIKVNLTFNSLFVIKLWLCVWREMYVCSCRYNNTSFPSILMFMRFHTLA